MLNPATSLRARFTAALAASVFAAIAAVLALTAAVVRDPGVSFDMTGRHPAILTGFYPAERVEDRTFAWSTDAVRLVLPGASRRLPWTCEADVINWRPPTAGPAHVRVATPVGDVTTATVADAQATLRFTLPAAPGTPFDVTIHIEPAFRPGPQDPRALGLAFDTLRCAPDAAATAWPAAGLLGATAGRAWLLGAAIGATGIGLAPASALAVGAALLQVGAQILGAGPYLPGEPPLTWLTWLAILGFLLPVWLLDLTGWRVLSREARAAVAVTAVACATKLAFILHPAKPLVDALFHAHRFEAVHAGQYYFTQLSTSATPFPYAIGLYVFALPWSALTDDYVLLLRMVVYAAEAGAGLLLYTLLARVWDARGAGVAAVGVFHVTPLPFAVIGNANLTNAFGQSASLAVLAAAAAWTFVPRGWWAFAALIPLATLAFISHVSVVVLLGATLVAVLVWAWLLGDRETRRQVYRALAAITAGVVLAVVLYWGHFGDVYRGTLARTRMGAAVGLSAPAPPAEPARPTAPARAPFTYSAVDLGRQAVRDLGWPLIVLAGIGTWEVLRSRRRDRLTILIAALCSVGAVFLAAGAGMPAPPRMQQDLWEFMGRVELAVYPAAALLAGVGVARGWQAGAVWRGLTALVLAAAGVLAAQAVLHWYA